MPKVRLFQNEQGDIVSAQYNENRKLVVSSEQGDTVLSYKERRAFFKAWFPIAGVILEEKISVITGEPIVIIATYGSKNGKTGPMVQIWIMHRNIAPLTAHSQGKDRAVCGDCPHRINGTCYVSLFHAPRAIFVAYKNGNYAHFDGDFTIFHSQKVRFGAYGDPALMDIGLVSSIVKSAIGWTGYTHQWKNIGKDFSQYFMASTDNPTEQKLANSLGWSTFMATPVGFDIKSLDVKCSICPAVLSEKIQCVDCMQCNGASKRIRNKIVPAHGKGASKYQFTQ